ncbi:MAG: phosphate signaling complex protein PhoU [Oscillospiraceae bacterium]|nr:phosphate signaling complex protein PhoU [Oscillospiraceae bacterium]
MTARMAFNNELQALHNDLVRMGGMIEDAIEKSVRSLEMHSREQAQGIIDGDQTVDRMEKDIESRCLNLLLRQQPVAGDLRAISTALKIITDMERIGDQAADIADITMHFTDGESPSMAKHLPMMAQVASDMVHKSVTAFVKNDLELARSTMEQDDEVDALFLKVRSDLISLLQSSADHADQAIDVMMMAKYLERIGDHAVNICEWVEFSITGEYKNTRIL